MDTLILDIDQPEFLPIEILMFGRMLRKCEQYRCQGRDLEAKGAARAIGIAFNTLKGLPDESNKTEWSEL